MSEVILLHRVALTDFSFIILWPTRWRHRAKITQKKEKKHIFEDICEIYDMCEITTNDKSFVLICNFHHEQLSYIVLNLQASVHHD